MENNYCYECKVLCSGKFCWSCGKEAISAVLKCPYCEETIGVIGKFCERCGKPVQEAVQEHIKREEEGGEKGGDTV